MENNKTSAEYLNELSALLVRIEGNALTVANSLRVAVLASYAAMAAKAEAVA
jgi:hypothetical protein